MVTGRTAPDSDADPQEGTGRPGLELPPPLRPLPTPPPDSKADDGSPRQNDGSPRQNDGLPRQNDGNAPAVAGFILSLIAVVPPALVAHHVATVPASTFHEDYGLPSLEYALFVFVFFLPFEVVFGVPATVLSVVGIVRAMTGARRRIAFGIAGLAVSLVALILTIGAFVLWDVRSS